MGMSLATSSTVFSGLLAAVVYGDDKEASGADAKASSLAIARFEDWFRNVSRESFYMECAQLDEAVLAKLPRSSMLRIAKLVDARFPDAVAKMPTLRAARDHLSRAGQLAKVFAPESLALLADALAAPDDEGIA